MASLLGDRLVEVQDHVGHRGVGGQLAGVEPPGRAGFADARAACRRRSGCSRKRASWSLEAVAAGSASSVGARAARQWPGGRPASIRASGVAAPRVITRWASTPGGLDERRLRSAASSACSGVLVRVSRTVQVSRAGASKVTIDGGATVRFQNVYRLRR